MHRITITVEEEFITEIDLIMAARGYENRSEAIRDLARAGMREVAKQGDDKGESVAALVYTFQPDRRFLSQRLATTFGERHDLVLASTRVQLDHETCFEVDLLRGPNGRVCALGDAVIAEKGVSYGRLVTVPVSTHMEAHSHGAHPHRHVHTQVRGA